MIIDDDYIINEFWSKSHLMINKKTFTDDVKQYLINRFADSESIKESIYRIKYNIIDRPTCYTCGNKVKFYGKPNYIFGKYCSAECKHNGNVGTLIKETKLKKYGNANYVNVNKAKQTCLEKYGVESVLQLKENIEKAKIASKTNEVMAKIKRTCLEKYGVENPWHQQHIKEKAKQNSHNKLSINKIKNTWKNKSKQEINTIVEKRKHKLNLLSEEQKQNIINKRKETCLEKYGVSIGYGSSKTIKTNLNKYGVENPSQNKIIKEKLSLIIGSKSVQNKINNTKRKNNSFNKSKSEDISYNLLKDKYPDVIRQYKSAVYPFVCDFYIPSLNLYIECNYHWTHGGHPYNSNNINDYNKLKLWESKNSKFYRNAIITWTCRDVNKKNVAKENNLNYLLFYNINELKNWINTYDNT